MGGTDTGHRRRLPGGALRSPADRSAWVCRRAAMIPSSMQPSAPLWSVARSRGRFPHLYVAPVSERRLAFTVQEYIEAYGAREGLEQARE